MPLAALLFLFLSGCASPEAPPTTPPAPMRTLFDFAPDGPDWTIENDGVMGGDSKGHVEIEGGTLTFTGTVVTEGGGFTSTRAPLGADLSSADGVELRVRGGGRTFEVDLSDGTRDRGREVGRRGPVPTSPDWQTVRVAFADLETTAHGEPVDVDPLDTSAVQSLALYIIDGQDGPFRLEVDWIRTYQAD